MNYKDKCRTCLASGKEMRHIHTTIVISGDNVKVSDILEDFYKFTVTSEDSYPDNICINCMYHLTMTYSFKKLVEASAKTLEESVLLDSIEYSYESDEETSYRFGGYEKQMVNTENTTESDQPLFCVECQEEFRSTESLREHCLNNHPVKSSTGRDCDYCDEKIEDYRSHVIHLKLHLKPYVCDYCLEGFYDETSLNSHSCQPSGHYKERRSSEVGLRQCHLCGRSYRPGYLRIHMRTHTNEMPYSCKFCPKKFNKPSCLTSHVVWNHKRTKNHKCEVCGATFYSSSSRSNHINKVHLKLMKYKCETCDKRFFLKSALVKHTYTHTGDRPFQCHLCDQSYTRKYRLTEHLKSHSETDAAK